MISVQSSGSMFSAKAVEPTTSANRHVTIFRSPARWAARIFSTSGAGVLAARRVWRASSLGVVAATGWPQLAQKRAPGDSSDWQLAQRAARAWPQLIQNL